PAPFGPISALTEFSLTLKFTLFRAVRPPKRFVTSLTSSKCKHLPELVNKKRDYAISQEQQRECQYQAICKDVEFFESSQKLRQHGYHNGADYPAPQIGYTSDNDHHQHQNRIEE